MASNPNVAPAQLDDVNAVIDGELLAPVPKSGCRFRRCYSTPSCEARLLSLYSGDALCVGVDARHEHPGCAPHLQGEAGALLVEAHGAAG
jgi:hypothetical protein